MYTGRTSVPLREGTLTFVSFCFSHKYELSPSRRCQQTVSYYASLLADTVLKYKTQRSHNEKTTTSTTKTLHSIMSLRTAINSLSPPVVASAGIAVLAGMSWVPGASLTVLQSANVTAFALNCFTVSIPGRIDGTQDQEMRPGLLSRSDEAVYESPEYTNVYSPSRGRTMVAPSGWAFAIWGPIYLGETVFVVAQYLPQYSGLDVYLPSLSVPFIAANLFQSLWCIAFRPHYQGWASYISAAMLGGTAYSLSQVHAVACTATGPAYWFLLPLSVHFGWTCAATLVNLSGSVSMDPNNSDKLVTAVGHSSALLATALGVGITLQTASPVYGFTLAWALSACADGMKQRESGPAKVQQKLCWTGALACALAAASTWIF